MKIQTELVTPERAAQLLEHNTKNRALRSQQVEFHINNLKNGTWRLTHQGVAVSRDGELLDGQHRLTAIVLSGIAAQMLVATDMDPEVFDVIDTGSRRTPGDVFHIRQISDPKLASSTVRILHNYSRDNWHNETVPHGKLLDLYYQAPGLDEAVALARSNYRDVGMKPSQLAAVLYLTRTAKVHHEVIETWLDQFLQGADIRPGDAAHTLRRQYRNLGADNKRVQPRVMIGMYGKAWEIWALKKPRVPQYIRFRDSDAMFDIQNPGSRIKSVFTSDAEEAEGAEDDQD